MTEVKALAVLTVTLFRTLVLPAVTPNTHSLACAGEIGRNIPAVTTVSGVIKKA